MQSYKNVFKKERFEKEILPYLPINIRNAFRQLDDITITNLEEIRIRAGQPLMLLTSKDDSFIDCDGNRTLNKSKGIIVNLEDVRATFELMCKNSVYAYQNEINKGFITLDGGHRVGFSGRVVTNGDNITNINHISSINIRISKQVLGCSDMVINKIIKNGSDIFNTLIISPPQGGKTTLLRDITRQVSNGIENFNFKGLKVGIVDERSEIAACYKGIPQNDVGIRTDVLDACPKTKGIEMLLRSMSPQVIVVDEIGNQGDAYILQCLINAGIKIIATAHGYSINDIKNREDIKKIIASGAFERFVILGKNNERGVIKEVI